MSVLKENLGASQHGVLFDAILLLWFGGSCEEGLGKGAVQCKMVLERGLLPQCCGEGLVKGVLLVHMVLERGYLLLLPLTSLTHWLIGGYFLLSGQGLSSCYDQVECLESL